MKPALPLEAFIRLLRQRGFEATTGDWLALSNLLSNESTWDLERLRLVLLATFARSLEQREELKSLFDAFFREPKRLAALPEPTATPPPQESPPSRRLAAALFFAVVMAAGAVSVNRPHRVDTDERGGGSATGGSGSTITTSGGNVGVAGVSHPATVPAKDRVEAPPNRGEDAAKSAAAQRERWALSVLGGGIAAVLCGIFLTRHRALRQEPHGPFIFDPTYAEREPLRVPHDARLLEDTAAGLGRRTSRRSAREIDVKLTVERTLRVGLPTIAFRAQAEQPRFLVLIDWSIRFRNVARFVATFAHELVDAGARCELRRFERLPSLCFEASFGHGSVLLKTLAQDGYAGMLFFGDPDVACGASADQPAAWLSELPKRGQRIWLFPHWPMQRSAGVGHLEEHGFRVELVTLRAFSALRAASSASVEPPLLPAMTEWRPDEYRRYLGGAFDLLCAATQLPKLSSSGVLFLAARLATAATPDELSLACGIGWVADGRWPLQLRLALAQELAASPALLDRTTRVVDDYMAKIKPERSTGAFNEFKLALLERALGTNAGTEGRLFSELVNGPAQSRSILKQSHAAQRWARKHRLSALPREVRIAALVPLLLLLWFARTLVPSPPAEHDAVEPAADAGSKPPDAKPEQPDASTPSDGGSPSDGALAADAGRSASGGATNKRTVTKLTPAKPPAQLACFVRTIEGKDFWEFDQARINQESAECLGYAKEAFKRGPVDRVSQGDTSCDCGVGLKPYTTPTGACVAGRFAPDRNRTREYCFARCSQTKTCNWAKWTAPDKTQREWVRPGAPADAKAPAMQAPPAAERPDASPAAD